jgi:methyl-accepting chemotaxis protein
MGIYFLVELKILDRNSEIIYEKAAIPLGLLVRTADLTQEMRVQVREWHIAKTDEDRDAAIKTVDKAHVALKELIAEQKNRIIMEEGKEVLDNLLVAVDKYVAEAHNCVETHAAHMKYGTHETNLSQSMRDAGFELRKAVIAVIEMRIGAAKNLSEQNSQTADRSIKISIIVLILAGLVSLSIGIYLTLSITGILNIIVRTVSKVENGDMTARSELERGDEFGTLANSIDSLALKLQSIIKDLRVDSDSLASSAEELSVVSNQLVNIAEESVSQSMTVTSTTNRMSTSINAIASAAEEASVNTEDVASAIEQVSTSINDMTNTIQEASVNVNEVAGIAEYISTGMNIVVNSVERMKIGINQIASNANKTCEVIDDATAGYNKATQAISKLGAAAKEMGEFAKSAKVDDIVRYIEGIQISTGEAVTAMNNVSSIIAKINKSVKFIYDCINQQTGVSYDIASNVEKTNMSVKHVAESIGKVAKEGKNILRNASQVNRGVDSVSRSMMEIAKGSMDIARSAEIASKGTKVVNYNVIDMNQAAQNSVQGAKQVSRNAYELARIASGLKSVVDRFRV